MEVEAVDVEFEDVGAAGDAGGEEGGGEGAWGDGGVALGDAGPGQVGVEKGQEVGGDSAPYSMTTRPCAPATKKG